MDSDKYLEGKSMQRPPLFESDHFIYWKNRFETYVKAKDLDLWHIILNGDFPPVARNKESQVLETVPFKQQDDDIKKKLAKNNEAKMVLYNVLPKKEYERIFMCKMAKDILQSLLITHQALNEGFSSKNYVRKFLTALHPKWRAKVTVIEESKDLQKKERIKSIALKAKKESSDDETSTSGSDNEEYAMAVRNFKKFSRRKGKFFRQPREERKSFRQRDEKKGKSDRKCFRYGDPSHLIGDCPKTSRNKDQKAFIEGSWSDSENDAEDKTNDKTCLMAQSSNEEFDNEVQLRAYCDAQGITHNFSALLEESLNVTFDESPPPTKLSPLVDDDVGEEEAIRKNTKIANTNIEEYESIEVDEIEPKNVNEALKDESWVVAMQEELNQFVANDYIKEMLKKFGLEDSKPTKTPMSTEIKLTKDDEADSVDSSKYQGDYVDRKSTSGVCTFMVCCLTSWFAKKQTALAISTAEAEYISAGKACQQALWMKQALIDYDICLDNVPIMCDNKGAIDLSKNPVQHSRTKHIEIRHHFLCDNVQKGNISIEKVASEDNIADIFTKPLKCEVFIYLRLGLGMMELIMDSHPSSSQK
ncbi:copia protein [Tanacetum coccineum]